MNDLELRIAIATLKGWTDLEYEEGCGFCDCLFGYSPGTQNKGIVGVYRVHPPNWPTDHNDAFRLVDEMMTGIEANYCLDCDGKGKYFFLIYSLEVNSSIEWMGEADTATRAICLAYLEYRKEKE